MRFVCCKCLRLVTDKGIIRMPFELSEDEYWCEECYNKWANGNPYRYPTKNEPKKTKSTSGKKKPLHKR